MFMQMFLLAICGTEGQVPTVLCGAIATQLLCGIYSFFGGYPQLAAVDALQSNGSQVALVGVSALNLLTAPAAGLNALLLFCMMSMEAYTSCTIWYSQNN